VWVLPPIQLELNKARYSQHDAIFRGAEFPSQLAMSGRYWSFCFWPSHGAEARACGRVAAAVPIYVDDQPNSQRCRAAKNPKAIRTASDATLSISGERNVSSSPKCEVPIGSKHVLFRSTRSSGARSKRHHSPSTTSWTSSG
jgi:hypothetical protein